MLGHSPASLYASECSMALQASSVLLNAMGKPNFTLSPAAGRHHPTTTERLVSTPPTCLLTLEQQIQGRTT